MLLCGDNGYCAIVCGIKPTYPHVSIPFPSSNLELSLAWSCCACSNSCTALCHRVAYICYPSLQLPLPILCVARGLQEERIEAITRIMPATLSGTDLDRTLLCFVLVDPEGKHAFCSRYDFGPWPLLGGVSSLPASVTQVGQQRMNVHGCQVWRRQRRSAKTSSTSVSVQSADCIAQHQARNHNDVPQTRGCWGGWS